MSISAKNPADALGSPYRARYPALFSNCVPAVRFRAEFNESCKFPKKCIDRWLFDRAYEIFGVQTPAHSSVCGRSARWGSTTRLPRPDVGKDRRCSMLWQKIGASVIPTRPPTVAPAPSSLAALGLTGFWRARLLSAVGPILVIYASIPSQAEHNENPAADRRVRRHRLQHEDRRNHTCGAARA
jgi:hypothetical protein